MKKWTMRIGMVMVVAVVAFSAIGSAAAQGPDGDKPPVERPGGPDRPGDLVQAFADITGLDIEDVRAELDAGKTLAEIAEEHDIDLDNVTAELEANLEARLEEAVAAGRLTEEEAAAELEAAIARHEEALTLPRDEWARPEAQCDPEATGDDAEACPPGHPDGQNPPGGPHPGGPPPAGQGPDNQGQNQPNTSADPTT
jgi:hypothetical protein